MIGQMSQLGIRYVYYSPYNYRHSRILAAKMGLDTGWNTAISLSDNCEGMFQLEFVNRRGFGVGILRAAASRRGSNPPAHFNAGQRAFASAYLHPRVGLSFRYSAEPSGRSLA